ncbi:hypothetical protein C0V73_07570 [Rhizobium sp. TH135]|nr:hypothetical protein C0V73_07570 [Rhizobium sp. TH135]
MDWRQAGAKAFRPNAKNPDLPAALQAAGRAGPIIRMIRAAERYVMAAFFRGFSRQKEGARWVVA